MLLIELCVDFRVQVVYYGLSAAGSIALTLANRPSVSEITQADMSSIFQNLSILVGEVENGTLVYVNSPNFALLSRATQTIKTLLGRMILPFQSSRDVATTSEGRSGALASSENFTALNDGEWAIWDDRGFQDFEMNFWHHLADHPFLNR